MGLESIWKVGMFICGVGEHLGGSDVDMGGGDKHLGGLNLVMQAWRASGRFGC